MKVSDGPEWICLIYLAVLLGTVYFSECFAEAGAYYYGGYMSLFTEADLWIYPLRHSKIILIETAAGYILGSIFHMVRKKKREKQRSCV